MKKPLAASPGRVAIAWSHQGCRPWGGLVKVHPCDRIGEVLSRNGPPDYEHRSIIVTHPNNAREIYLYRGDCTYWNGSAWMPAQFSPVPSVSSPGTFDNTPRYRNSFYWDQKQSEGLPAYVSSFQISHFLKARMRHWLCANDTYYTLPDRVLSLERAPSPDGTTAGQITWYDYAGKPQNDLRGTQVMPTVVARVLPDSTTWYESAQYNGFGLKTTVTSTYSNGSSVSTRTQTYAYAANNLDLTQERGPNNELLVSYTYNNNHQVLTESRYAIATTAYVTTNTYDAQGRLTQRQKPSGLTATFSCDATTGYLSQQTEQPTGKENGVEKKMGSKPY